MGNNPPYKRIFPDYRVVGTADGGESGRFNAFDLAKLEATKQANRTLRRAASLAA